MSLRVAVASSDGQWVNRSLIRTGNFFIFEREADGAFRFLEVRRTKPPCGGGDRLYEHIKIVGDCQIALASQVSYSEERAFSIRNIQTLAFPGTVEEGLKQVKE